MNATSSIACLDCGQDVKTESILQEGQVLTCPNCQTLLEVVNLNPVDLDWAYTFKVRMNWEEERVEEEDWR